MIISTTSLNWIRRHFPNRLSLSFSRILKNEVANNNTVVVSKNLTIKNRKLPIILTWRINQVPMYEKIYRGCALDGGIRSLQQFNIDNMVITQIICPKCGEVSADVYHKGTHPDNVINHIREWTRELEIRLNMEVGVNRPVYMPKHQITPILKSNAR